MDNINTNLPINFNRDNNQSNDNIYIKKITPEDHPTLNMFQITEPQSKNTPYIKFNTREKFAEAVLNIPNRKANHVIVGELNPKVLKEIISNDTAKSTTVTIYPNETLVHAVSLIVDHEKKEVIFLPDDIFNTFALDNTYPYDTIAQQLDTNYTIKIPVTYLYDGAKYTNDFQSDENSCSHIAYQFVEKYNQMLEHPESKDNFIEIPREYLPDKIQSTDTSPNQKEFSFTLDKQKLNNQYKFYILPKKILGITQKRSPVILNTTLTTQLKNFTNIDLAQERYHSNKINNRQRWEALFTNEKYNNSTTLILDKTDYLAQKMTTQNKISLYSKKTSIFRKDILKRMDCLQKLPTDSNEQIMAKLIYLKTIINDLQTFNVSINNTFLEFAKRCFENTEVILNMTLEEFKDAIMQIE